MRLSASSETANTAGSEVLREVDRAVEGEGTVLFDVDPETLVVTDGVEVTDGTGLDEVVGDSQVLLIGGDLDVVRTNNGLLHVGVIETLDVVEVGDIKLSDVVASGAGEVGEATVRGDVRVDGGVVLCLLAESIEKLSLARLAVLVGLERVDDPDLTGVDGGCDGGVVLVTWDELDILDTSTVGDGDGVDDGAAVVVPETESVGVKDLGEGLENSGGNDEVGGQDEVSLNVDGQTVGRELLAKDVEKARNVFGPLVNDIVVGIDLNETARGGADGRTHVGDQKATVGQSANLVGDGAEQTAVALLEDRLVWVGDIEEETSVLSLQQAEKTTTPDGLAIGGRAGVVRRVTRGWHLGDTEESAEGVVVKRVRNQEVGVRVVTGRGPLSRMSAFCSPMAYQ
jgi:hypothetical protein